MMAHEARCLCPVCRELRQSAVGVIQEDRNVLAGEWAKWRGAEDGEVRKLLAGEDGNHASPRWVALQAVARMRLHASQGAA